MVLWLLCQPVKIISLSSPALAALWWASLAQSRVSFITTGCRQRFQPGTRRGCKPSSFSYVSPDDARDRGRRGQEGGGCMFFKCFQGPYLAHYSMCTDTFTLWCLSLRLYSHTSHRIKWTHTKRRFPGLFLKAKAASLQCSDRCDAGNYGKTRPAIEHEDFAPFPLQPVLLKCFHFHFEEKKPNPSPLVLWL